jgi:serine/threonine-protein kinase
MSFAAGENVGAYRIVEQLGSGGMATVYKAYHAALDRYVALKVMHPAFKGDPNFLARFQREARVVAKLEHPNIVPVYDFSEHEGSPFLVMRFVEGETLKARLERARLTLPEILDVVRPVGEALTYAHEQGVLHRDIKPSNIILAQDERVFLTDFGLARIVQAGESSLTRDAMVGTPYYISPEQAVGQSDLDARTDVYSFGVVLYELFTGRVPFQSDTPFAVVHDHIYSPLPLPTSINPDLPPELERVLLKAMAKETDDRYDSAVALVTAVKAAVTGVAAVPAARPASVTPPTPSPPLDETVPARPAPTPPPTPVAAAPKPRNKWPWLLALGGLAALAMVAVVALFLIFGDGDEQDWEDVPLADLEEQIMDDIAGELGTGRDLGDTLAELEAIVDENPQAIEAYLEGAALLMQQGDFGTAIEVLHEGVMANPDVPILHLNLARALVADDSWEDALPELEWLIDHTPDMPEPHAYLSVHMAVNVGDLEAARELALTAQQLDPDSPEVHFALGVYHWKNRDLRQARLALGRARRAADASPWLRRLIEFYLEKIDRSD